MTKPKLVKNTKTVRLPRRTNEVKSAFERAQRAALDQRWNKVIIIGEGKECGQYFHSSMDINNFYGLLKVAEHRKMRDSEDD